MFRFCPTSNAMSIKRNVQESNNSDEVHVCFVYSNRVFVIGRCLSCLVPRLYWKMFLLTNCLMLLNCRALDDRFLSRTNKYRAGFMQFLFAVFAVFGPCLAYVFFRPIVLGGEMSFLSSVFIFGARANCLIFQ